MRILRKALLLVTFAAIDVIAYSFHSYVLGYIYVRKRILPVCKTGTALGSLPPMQTVLIISLPVIFIVLHLWHIYYMPDTEL